jgi:predicted RNA-binding protein with RPS1 domain
MARWGFAGDGLWRVEKFPQTDQKLQMLWQRVMAKSLAIKLYGKLSLSLSSREEREKERDRERKRES